ncbi:NAD(P)/FAD-dependent oxidoreductase [Legionella feeleii]|uniref:Protein CbrA n=1 Tax=Legionella feeleii TaxID=453 RepID=A0A378J617_9GAMM|nr:NAD(P)/FAD-dependent oxidoreductase [Legionella feeleii]STX39704.1 FAD dependent oxidoreductase [Legionella feeleii]
MKLDALIIGGGPAGATTALLLAKAGWSVGLIEKKRFPRRKVCGEFLSATNLPLLQKLGIAEFYLSQSGPEVRRVGLYTADTVVTSAMPLVGSSIARGGRALGREHLDTALLHEARINGAHIWQPAEAKTLQRQANEFICTFRDGNETKELSAAVIVRASGSWEKQVGRADIKDHKPSDLLAFKAHFLNANLPSDLMPLLAFPGGYGGLVHSDHQRVTLSCCIRRDTLHNLRLDYPGISAGEAVLQYIMAHCRGVRETLTHAERQGNWLAAGPIHPGIRYCYKDHQFFAGNLAGEAHPVVAEGISMAMQSAWLLSQTLIAHKNEILTGKGLNNAGADYTKQWRKHFVKRIHSAAVFAQLAMMRPWAHSLLLPLVKQFPGILTFGAKLSGKIQQVLPIE